MKAQSQIVVFLLAVFMTVGAANNFAQPEPVLNNTNFAPEISVDSGTGGSQTEVSFANSSQLPPPALFEPAFDSPGGKLKNIEVTNISSSGAKITFESDKLQKSDRLVFEFQKSGDKRWQRVVIEEAGPGAFEVNLSNLKSNKNYNFRITVLTKRGQFVDQAAGSFTTS